MIIDYNSKPRSEPTYDVLTEKDIMVPMRDGVNLATDVYRPASNGKPVEGTFPVLLERTPYDKEARGAPDLAAYFVQRGYVMVRQDNRGRYKSEGTFTKYVDDANDGYDCLQWIGSQDWCNGKVGTYGTSYGAHTQGAMASTDPPFLGAMIMDSGAFSNAYMCSCRHNGAFELRQVTWAFNQALVSKEASEDPVIKAALESTTITDWFSRLPWKKGLSPLKWVPDYEEYLLEIWTHSEYDDYWKQPGLCAEEHYDTWSDVPQLHFGSWYDSYTRTTCDNYVALSNMKKAPVRLLMGPWTHGQRSLSYSGEVDFGAAAPLDGNLAHDYDDFRLAWFDAWFKGLENDVEKQPPVLIFVMGGGDGRINEQGRLNHGGYWRFENEWPLARAKYANFHLHADGSLSEEVPAADAPPSRYQFDPDHPVPTIGGNMSSGPGILDPGAYHQAERPDRLGSREPYLPLSSRHDVLVFQTPPLDDDVEITGPITVNLWISSSAVDTDFTAKLLDIYPPCEDYPDGFDMNISDSIMRARFRDSWEEPELMTPGQIYKLSFPLYPTSNLFKKGHRIRVDVSSSNFPRFDVNPNTGEPLGRSLRKEVAVNAVYHDREHPSHVVLPVVGNGQAG